jgi:molybdopterin synthase catalytic subunit
MELPMKYLTYDMIHPQAFISPPNAAGLAGGTVLFFGTIRCDRTPQQRVTHLVYEAYESLADQMIDDLISKTLRVWPVLGAKVLHRLGTVGMGETAVAIEVRSAHRDEAYQASRFLIDQIKEAVPIWKKEYFEDGLYRWGRCEHGGRAPQLVVYPPLRGGKDRDVHSADGGMSSSPLHGGKDRGKDPAVGVMSSPPLCGDKDKDVHSADGVMSSPPLRGGKDIKISTPKRNDQCVIIQMK